MCPAGVLRDRWKLCVAPRPPPQLYQVLILIIISEVMDTRSPDIAGLFSATAAALTSANGILGTVITGGNAPATDLSTLEGDIGSLKDLLTSTVTSLDGLVGTGSASVTQVNTLLVTLKNIVGAVGKLMQDLHV